MRGAASPHQSDKLGEVAERSSNDFLPTTSLGQYQIRSRIGSGGMGDVYDAVHTALNKRVAIKTLRKRFLDDETTVARFLREGQLASRIRHPNIVDVTDVGMIGGLPCLVMEFLDGEPLSAMIRRDGALPLAALVDVLLPIIAAVDFAHEQHVLHRDIKPSNIFLARSWNGEVVPKILDFGISKLVHESAQAALTTDSAFVGTPHYASPELMRADKNTDGRSDQYSIGVVLYEAATGVRPFTEKAGSFVALAMAICAGEFPTPRQVKPDLPEAFEKLILRAMSLSANDRYPSMRALGEALLPFASERARLIWSPTFRDKSSIPQMPQETQVLLRPPMSQSGSVSVPHATPLSMSGYPHHTGGTPRPGFYPSHPSATPPASASFDRSFVHGGQPQNSGATLRALAMPLGGLALAAAVLVAILLARNPGPRTTTAQPPPATTFVVEVATVPETATIEVDGVAVGTARFSRAFVKDGQKHTLRVSAPAHETVLVAFDDVLLPPSHIALRPAPVAEKPQGKNPDKPVVAPIPHGGAPVIKAGGAATKPTGERPKTDNIDPWE